MHARYSEGYLGAVLGATKVRGNSNAGSVLEKVLDGGNRSTDTYVSCIIATIIMCDAKTSRGVLETWLRKNYTGCAQEHVDSRGSKGKDSRVSSVMVLPSRGTFKSQRIRT